MPGKVIVWPEPSLLFTRSQGQRVIDPKQGLLVFHPLDYNLGIRDFDSVNISVIYPENTFDHIQKLFYIEDLYK